MQGLPAAAHKHILDTQPELLKDIARVPGRRVTMSISPVVTSLDLSSSSPTSSSSMLRPGKKKPIILWKNWWVSWIVSGTTFTCRERGTSEPGTRCPWGPCHLPA